MRWWSNFESCLLGALSRFRSRFSLFAVTQIRPWFAPAGLEGCRNFTTRSAACVGDLDPHALMIAPHVEVEPRGGPIELPHAGRDATECQLFRRTDRCQTIIGPEPYAMPLRAHLTPAVAAPAAWTVANVLGALGFRAKKRDVLNGAIPTAPAAEEQCFRRILHNSHHEMPRSSFVHLTGHNAQSTR